MHALHFDTHACTHTRTHSHTGPTARSIWLTGFDELFVQLCHARTSRRLAVTDTTRAVSYWDEDGAFISKRMLTLLAYVCVATPVWSSSPSTVHSCKLSKSPSSRERHFHCKAAQCITGRDEKNLQGDLSLQVMKYTFFREGHTAGPSEWGICNDKTMIYSGWSSRGRVRNTLTMIYYLLSAKMELCCSQGRKKKKSVLLFSVSYWGDSLLSDRQAQQQLPNVSS